MSQAWVTCSKFSAPLEFACRQLQQALEQSATPLKTELYAEPESHWPCQADAQGYQLYVEKDVIIIAGADEAGAMYGALDVAQHFNLGGTAATLKADVVNAYIKQRGIKFNLPLDARTPSYTDCGDSAQENIINVWDMDFWHGYLDRLAMNKYNVLSLWNMSPGPSMVRVPEYPDVALEDVKRATYVPHSILRGMELYTEVQASSLITLKKMSIDEKICFWQDVMTYARDRCISVYLFVWNVFVYGTEHTDYGITDRADNPVTKDYVRCTADALVRTYPLLAGIGVTAGENMRIEWKIDVREDVEWIMDTYGQGIKSALQNIPEREFTLIHRSHMTTVEQMEDVFADFPYNFEVSYKYSMAHMYAAVKPHFGDQFFAQLKNGRKSWLTVRDDDFYLLRWGDVEFARAYLENMPVDVMSGFNMGSDGIIWAREYASREPAQNGVYFLDRHWYSLAIWGQLSYNITLPDTHFRCQMIKRYGADGDAVYEAMRCASRAIPLQQRVYWRDYDFQWYPEASCSYLEAEDLLVFRTLNDFIAGSACPGTGYLSISEYVEGLCQGQVPPGITPDTAGEEIRQSCLRSLIQLQTIKLNTHPWNRIYWLISRPWHNWDYIMPQRSRQR